MLDKGNNNMYNTCTKNIAKDSKRRNPQWAKPTCRGDNIGTLSLDAGQDFTLCYLKVWHRVFCYYRKEDGNVC